jgi:hypothetical protein
MKQMPVYSIGREFLGNISVATFLVRIVRNHLTKESENRGKSNGEEVEKCAHI